MTYGRNLRGDIVERAPGSFECKLFWQDGDRVCASDGGMNLLFELVKELANRPSSDPPSCAEVERWRTLARMADGEPPWRGAATRPQRHDPVRPTPKEP